VERQWALVALAQWLETGNAASERNVAPEGNAAREKEVARENEVAPEATTA